jgi:hypothetical protein
MHERYEEACKFYEQAVGIKKSYYGRNAPNLKGTLREYARALDALHKTAEAEKLRAWEKTLPIIRM